jgi:3-dehydroquinate synthase
MRGGSEAPRGLLRLTSDTEDADSGGPAHGPGAPAAAQAAVRQRFAVPIEYPVLFERDCLSPAAQALDWAISRVEPGRLHEVYVVLDAGVVDATPDLLARVDEFFAARSERLDLRAAPLVLPGGEAVKADWSIVSRLHQAWLEGRLDRHSVVVAIGGGALLDAVGFAAATFHRGLRLVRVPTTVLGQNDAGLGVKNGLNALGQKNLVGTFAAPFAVVCDAAFFQTLEPRDSRAGMAEAVKVALIRDRAFFEWLEAHASALARFDAAPLEELVRRAAELHLGHIARGGDPFESGSARPLDFGHWAAHKLEVSTEHELRHGEAVAIGLALDTLLSAELGFLPRPLVERVLGLLRGLGFALFHPELARRSGGELSILAGLEDFRQHMGGHLAVPMLRDLGQSCEVGALDPALIERAVAELERMGA